MGKVWAVGKVSVQYREGRKRPWRARWREKVNGQYEAHEKSFTCGLKAGAFRALHLVEGETYDELAMSPTDRARWWQIKADCALAGVYPEEAITAGIQALKRVVQSSEAIGVAIELYELDAKKRKLRTISIQNVVYAARAFAASREAKPVGQFTGEEILQWVEAQYTDQESRDIRLAKILTFFRWCAVAPRKWTRIDLSAVRFTHRVARDKKRVSFYTHEEATRICHHAAPNIALAVATGFLLGVRPFELMRLEFSATIDGEFYGFDEARGEWHIPPQWAKTRAYRKLYALPDAWWYWLLKYRGCLKGHDSKSKKNEGRMVPMNYRNFRSAFRTARLAAGVKRNPKDGLRHSFGTHGFHRSEDGKERGLEWCISIIGHVGGYKTFDKRYNGRVSSSEGAAYFLNYPDGSACCVKTRARLIVTETGAEILREEKAPARVAGARSKASSPRAEG